MTYAFSPATGEIIVTDSPADWMGTTTIQPPQYDPQTEGCFWVDGAWTVVPAVPAAEPAPAVVSMRQARLALLAGGLLGQVAATIDSLPEPERTAAQIEWEFSQEVRRNNPLLQSVSQSMGMTAAQVDALFVAAAEL